MNFTNPVTYTTAALNDGTGVVASDSGSGTNQITLNLTGVTDVQRITMALYGATDTVTLNSGDVGLRMGVLIGDTTDNGSVANASDVAQTKAESGSVDDRWQLPQGCDGQRRDQRLGCRAGEIEVGQRADS